MDYGLMLAYHAEREADLTIACIEVPLEEAKGFGVMHVDDQKRIINFVEKPKDPPPMPNRPDHALASMGIYIFSTAFLFEQLIKDADNAKSSHDFGHDIIPNVINNSRVFAYPFRDVQSGVQAYWRDVGELDSYWAANMELIGVDPELNLYDREWPIWTYQAQTPPAKFIFDDDDRRGMAVDSMVSGGCIISGSEVKNSLLFSNVRVNSYSSVEDSVILPEVNIGRHCRIRKAVIDRGCHIPPNTVIGENLEDDKKRFDVSPGGVVLVTPDHLGQTLHFAR
jgi:glucose-1-phosphate adenylyltransferase